MSETDCIREPIEIIELILPRCTNVQGTAPCTATETGDGRCFNTRATCTSVADFQARPLAHLEPDILVGNGDAIASGDFTNLSDPLMFKVSVTFKANPSGTIWEQGGTTDGIYLGFTSGDLVFRAYDSSVADGVDTAKITVSGDLLAGRTCTLYGSINNGTVRLWEFDPVELVLTKLGEDTLTGTVGNWADTDGGLVGDDSGTFPTGETGGAFNGIIGSLSLYENTTESVLDETQDAYRQRYFFDDGRKAVPADDIYILPLLLKAESVGTRLNITGSDQRYEPIGRRAFMNIDFADAPHSDFPYDPYLADRSYDPLTRSTFWSKWMIRNKFGKTRGLVRRYTGYANEKLSQMRSQTYVLDNVKWASERFSIECRDYLSLTEFRRTQVPAATDGQLAADMTNVQTTMTLVGDQTDAYTETGTLRINDELMTYTGRTVNGTSGDTDFTGLTRGTDGSEAAAHSVDDNAQLCRRYTAERLDTVLEELLITDSQIPAQLVNLAEITSEYDLYMDAYLLTTVISEPTGVDRLVGELAEQLAFYIWWNERDQIIDLQALRALDTVDVELTQEGHIVRDSFTLSERPKERVTTLTLYYNPRDFAGDLNKPTNYKNQLIVSNSSGSDLDQYATLPQIREIFSRWLTTQNVVNQTGARYSRRYVDVPLYSTLKVDAKDRQYWVGDFVRLSHDALIDKNGARDASRRWLIIEAEEEEAGHSQKLTLVDITLDGKIYRITENGIGNYTPELFEAGNAFITDAGGLNPDASRGATIS